MHESRAPEQVIGPSIAYLPLTRNAFALIDAGDLALVQGTFWHCTANGYAARKVAGRTELLHRLLCSTDLRHIDHGNQNTLDNRRSNLRPAQPWQNMGNRWKTSRNTSGFKGVSRVAGTSRYKAEIRKAGRKQYLGTFETAELAHAAYSVAAEQHFKEFARTQIRFEPAVDMLASMPKKAESFACRVFRNLEEQRTLCLPLNSLGASVAERATAILRLRQHLHGSASHRGMTISFVQRLSKDGPVAYIKLLPMKRTA